MDTLKLLLWLAILAVVVLQVSCGSDKEKKPKKDKDKKAQTRPTNLPEDPPGVGVEGGVDEGKKKVKGCVVALTRTCNVGNYTFKCREPLSQPENGGAECPPPIEPRDPLEPDEVGDPCVVGPWGDCLPLPGYPGVEFKRRSPTDATADISTCDPLVILCTTIIRVDCVMTAWSIWYYFPDIGIWVRVRFIWIEPLNGGTPCPHDIEISTTGCFYTVWSQWFVSGTVCYRFRNVISPSNPAVCRDTFEIDMTMPCGVDPSCPWGPWESWFLNNANPCRQTRRRTRRPPCTERELDIERDCPCTFSEYGPWYIKTTSPCIQERVRYRLPPCQYSLDDQQRSCELACGPLAPTNIGEGVEEGPAGPNLAKRDEPWCPEETWIIYGREDGCIAERNATWFKCINYLCQGCTPPAGSGLICRQDKYTILTVPLICPGGGRDSMEVSRPMACSCYEVNGICDKWMGPC